MRLSRSFKSPKMGRERNKHPHICIGSGGLHRGFVRHKLRYAKNSPILGFITIITIITWIYPPPRIPVANEGLVVGVPYFLKMVHNPGGDWNPGWGVDLNHNNQQPHHKNHRYAILGHFFLLQNGIQFCRQEAKRFALGALP